MSFIALHLPLITILSLNHRRYCTGSEVLSPNPSPFLKSELCFLDLFPASIKENTSEV